MDDVQLQRAPEGGMEIRMVKRVQPADAPGTRLSAALNPLFLTTAIEAVVRAGDMQMAQFGGDLQIDKKGTIDLVTEVDVAVERMFRALIAERFPDHQVLAEEMGGAAARAGRARAGCSIRSTARPTSRTACRSSARRWRSRSTASPRSAAVYDPTRQELFTAERGGGAFLNGRPLRVSAADDAGRRDAGHRLSLRRPLARRRNRRPVRRVRRPGARGAAARVGGDRSLLRRGRTHGRVLGERPEAVGHRRPAR